MRFASFSTWRRSCLLPVTVKAFILLPGGGQIMKSNIATQTNVSWRACLFGHSNWRGGGLAPISAPVKFQSLVVLTTLFGVYLWVPASTSAACKEGRLMMSLMKGTSFSACYCSISVWNCDFPCMPFTAIIIVV